MGKILNLRNLGFFGICALPLVPLFFWHHVYSLDWENHVWMIGYYGEFFRHHLSFPMVFNTNQIVGMPYPIFYGPLFYPLMGIFSSFINPNTVIRSLIIFLVFIQFFSTRKVIEIIHGDKRIATIVAAVVMWSIYPLTNLYSRGAEAEFVSVALLHCGICWLFLLCIEPEKYLKSSLPAVLGMTLILMMGTHSITGICGLCFFLLIALIILPGKPYRKKILLWFAAYGIAAAVCLSSWIYALDRFGQDIQIVKTSKTIKFYSDLDSLKTRLWPLPYDPRIFTQPVDVLSKIDNPFVDLQINLALLILCILLIVKFINRNSDNKTQSIRLIVLVAIGFFGFVSSLILSISPVAWDQFFPSSFHIIQLAYRLISYCNLFLLVVALGILGMFKSQKLSFKLFVIPILLAALAVGLKIPRALTITKNWQTYQKSNNSQAKTNYAELTPRFYGYWAYLTLDLFPDLTFIPIDITKGKITFYVQNAPNFGHVSDVDLDLKEKFFGISNVQIFPWNHISVDGRIITDDKKVYWDTSEATVLEAGKHSLSYQFNPDSNWVFLRTLSLWTFFLLFCCTIIYGWRKKFISSII